MAICPNCGEEVPEDSSFCTHCGQDLSDVESLEEVEMPTTTTNSIEGREIEEYLGIVSGEAMMGADIMKDLSAGIKDIVGGRSGKYEEEIRKGRTEAMKDLKDRAKEMEADAVIGISVDYEEMSEGMLWINVTGTAVELA